MKRYPLYFAFFAVVLCGIFPLTHFRISTIQAQSTASTVNGKFYQFDIAAESGQSGLTGMGTGVSINDIGTVAFIGKTTAPYETGEGVFVRSITGITPVNVSPGLQSTSRVFGNDVQINNNNQAISRDRVPGPITVTRVWDTHTLSGRTIATGGLGNSPYATEYNFGSLNNLVDASDASKIENLTFGAIKTPSLPRGCYGNAQSYSGDNVEFLPERIANSDSAAND